MAPKLAQGFREANMDDLMQYLAGKEAGPFKAETYYSSDGDFMTFFLRDDQCYAERVDELLTVYRADANDDLVGCKVKGVSLLMQRLQKFGVRVTPEGGAPLSILFLSAASDRPPEQQKYYEEMGRFTSDVPLYSSVLQPA